MTIQLSNQLVLDGGPIPPRTSATAGYTLDSTGDIRKTVNLTTTDIGDWITPKSGMSGHSAKFDVTSGALSGGVTGTYQNLATPRNFFVTQSSAGTKTATVTVSIKNDSTGVVEATCSVTVTATLSH